MQGSNWIVVVGPDMATERLMNQLDEPGSLYSVADDREGGNVINLLYPIGDPQKVWDDAEADLEKKKLLVLGHPALPWKELPLPVKKIIVGKLAPVPAFTSTPRDDIYRKQLRMLEAEVAEIQSRVDDGTWDPDTSWGELMRDDDIRFPHTDWLGPGWTPYPADNRDGKYGIAFAADETVGGRLDLLREHIAGLSQEGPARSKDVALARHAREFMEAFLQPFVRSWARQNQPVVIVEPAATPVEALVAALGECRSVEHEMTPEAARLLIADGPLAKQLFADHYDALSGSSGVAVQLVKLRS